MRVVGSVGVDEMLKGMVIVGNGDGGWGYCELLYYKYYGRQESGRGFVRTRGPRREQVGWVL